MTRKSVGISQSLDNENTDDNTGRVDIIDNDLEDMPLTADMTEAISYANEPPNPNKQTGKVEIMDEEDDEGPTPPAAMIQNSLDAADNTTEKTCNKKIRKVEIDENEDDVPVPPALMFEDEDTIAKQKVKEEMDMNIKPAAATVLPDSIHAPPTEDIEDTVRGITNVGDGSNNRRGWGDIDRREHTNTVQLSVHDEEEGIVIGTGGDRVSDSDEQVDNEAEENMMEDTDREGNSIRNILEAYPVDDDLIIATIAEPNLPGGSRDEQKYCLALWSFS